MTGSNRISPNDKKPTFVDLFCGCGGFTLGMLRAGFNCKAAIDFNPQAVATLKANLTDAKHSGFSSVEYALERDLTQFPPKELEKLIGTNRLDVIVGGPPCQGFSTARQRDGSNHGTERLKEDSRRHLFRNFLDYVEYFQPKVFVIENVLGLRSAAGGKYFTAVQHEARVLGRTKGLPGYRVHPQIERGEKLGVPQKRRRQLIIGVRADLPGYFPTELKPAKRAGLGAMLGDAIGDLPQLSAGEGENTVRHGTKPKTRASFWLAKITGNKARDRRVNRLLRARGWTVVRVWEHELRRRDEAKLIRRLSNLCPRRPQASAVAKPMADRPAASTLCLGFATNGAREPRTNTGPAAASNGVRLAPGPALDANRGLTISALPRCVGACPIRNRTAE